MKKIIFICFALILVFSSFNSAFAYSECDGYTTEVEDEDYYKKYYGEGFEVNVCNWGEYIANDSVNFLDVNKEFEELTGIKVNYTLFSTNEELYAKLRSGSVSYDVIVPSDYMIGKMISEDMLEKIDYNNVPNYNNINEIYKNKPHDPNNEYSVPMYWGVVGIVYNTKMVDEEDLTGWDILWNENYSGNILMFSNSRDAFAISLLDLGYSVNTTNESELAEAAVHLVEQKPLVQSWVMDEIYDKMEGGEAAVAPYYSGDAVLMMDECEDLDFYFPENTTMFIDAFCIPKGAQNKEAAEMYINYMSEATISAANSYYQGYSIPSDAAFELLDEDIQENPVAYPDTEYLATLDTLLTLDANTSTIVDQYWADFMASSTSTLYYSIVLIIFFGGATIFSIIRKIKKHRELK